LRKDDAVHRRFRKSYEVPKMYCERCVDAIKRQEAIDRREAAMRRYEHERKYGRVYHVPR
jgi:hypothetical protein